VVQVFADFSTVHPVRFRPRGPSLTFSGEVAQASHDEVAMKTEDQAAILLRLSNGAIGTLLVSQVSAGRKNGLSFEIDGGQGSLAWNSEDPNHLWLGHRKEPNQMLDKDPALLSPAARALCGYPGGHQEGYPDTFRHFFASVYAAVADPKSQALPDFPTFDDGHREMVTCEALLESARTGRWVELPPA
jgi:predicted dehydrogenase